MENKRTKTKWLLGIIGVVILAGGILRWVVFQPYLIPTPSMEPGMAPGDHILVNRLSYRFWAPTRGDVVVFAFPKDLKRTFVKRVIAAEGETVELRDNKVFVNGDAIPEPYVKPGDYPPYGPERVPEGKVFVLGDNRRESEDSREWGLLPKNYLLGKAWLVYYPFQRFRFISRAS
ncbi:MULTISPECIES: signal peptidase I [Desulfosporosinus]|uniref:Signal peptidase I n=1 Tax=Desulfosporosinus nitroreducens TaxID=2018668 RepID=A0ABT8QJW5_9FIRM|nr:MULTISPECIES: signal peptidase I [Desulfosporosinus]MCB8813943.1 signal peptidase I [Desulfosporosinus sp. SRJS8]MCO1601113.1 signal peptidase I [Desulfosporosinus nitroreducens]MDO0821617.1 signal peptidase I [Desulfosporosinus nitroreducens]